MNGSAEALATGIDHANRIIMNFTEDLKGNDWLHRPCAEANCAAWTLGHLVLSARGFMRRAGATDLPALPEGFEQRFGREADAPRSSDFGDTSTLRPMFEESHKQFAAFVRTLSPEKISQSLGSDHPFFRTIGTMLAFAPIHISMHAGQISTIRRSLGRPPLV